jgi:hypothetical protein
MTKMFIDPSRPGIIRWNDDPTAGILAGVRAAEIVQAVNDAAGLRAEIERLTGHLRLAYPYVNDAGGDFAPALAEEIRRALEEKG